MKKKVLVVAAVLACIAIAAAGTLAYFTDSVQVHNVITSDAVDVEIIEKTLDENGKEIDWPHEEGGIKGAMPDTSVMKKVSIDNKTAQPVWVRVKLVVTINDGKLPVVDPDINKTVVKYSYDEGKLAFNTQYWKYNEENGYYYYKTELAGNATSEPLIDAVEFTPEMGNEYQNCTVEVDVYAQAVQSKNNPGATGWPEE